MLLIVGYEYQIVCQCHGGDGDIRVRKRVTLLPPLAEQIAGELRVPSHWVEFEAVQKRVCFGLFAWAHPM